MFSPEQAKRICEAIENGDTLRQVAQSERCSASLIMKYAREDDSFGKQYARAMELRTDGDFEQLDALQAEQPQLGEKGVDSAWVAWRKLQVDTLKWSLSKRVPKKYGDKLEHSGDPDRPLVVRTLADFYPQPPKEK